MTPIAPACAHCGLPLPRRPARVVLEGRTETCCCYGCVLALTVTRGRGDGGIAAAMLVRLGLAVFFTMNVMMVTMPTYASVVYGGHAPVDGPMFVLLRGLGVLLATPVLLLLGGPVLASALGTLRSGLGVDALVVVGAAAAYGLSLASLLRGGTEIYVDTACMLLVLVTVGRYLEAQAKAEASAAVRATLGPATLTARRLHGGREERVEAAVVGVGECLVVGPGDRFPTDGVVERGVGGVDESVLTGEAEPQLKEPGDEVSGGTCSVDGRFVVRVTRPLADSAAARIADLLRAALATRTAAERLADRAAAVLGPLAIVLAAAAGVWWAGEQGLGRGIMVSLSVLVVACPCALGIATPAAMWMAVAAAAERGIVLRSAPVLERLARVGRILFDKTGTLTRALPQVRAVEALPGGGFAAADVLRLAAALEGDVPHPVARALVAMAGAEGVAVGDADDVCLLPGRGVTGHVEGRAVTVANVRGLAERGLAVDDPEQRWTWVVVDDRVVGRLLLADALEPEVPDVLAALRARGLRLGLVTGAAHADGIVPALIDPWDAVCSASPAGKIAAVERLRGGGGVAMVGDGLNDAPALAAADVGIAVARASDLTRVAADVVLLGGGVAELPWLMTQARRTVRIARQNLAWAFAYNTVALALAAAGQLTPVVAALAMFASSATVIANARRLRAPRRRGAVAAAPGGRALTPVPIAAARS